MTELNLPSFQVNLRNQNELVEIFDIFRRKFIRLTPEEWVRQHFAHFLVNHKNYPKGLLSLEYSFKLEKRQKRADIIAFNRQGKAKLIVECKSPDVKISQKVFDQIARYNMSLKVDYLIVTNGLQHYACILDYKSLGYKFLNDIPFYSELV
jgi:hypothetical protein